MTNKQIAEKLHELADLLEIDGEANTFRISGLHRAGRVIESLPTPAPELLAKGELERVPGIGKGTAKRVEELINNGTLRELEELHRKIPQGLLDMLRIPDVGPKTVQQVWKALHVNTVYDLETACRQGRLRALKGFGERTEQKILKGIALYRQGQKRKLLGYVLPAALQVLEQLGKRAKVERLLYAGSARRRKETVGDLDFLVVAEEPEGVMEAFCRLPMVKEVLAKGKTKSSVLAEANLQMDLRVVPRESFGAALQYFTGSKEHNVALRSLARKRDLTVNEYGVFTLKDEKKVAGETEEEVYEVLGLAWIPPELRENTGEIEAAAAGELPDLVEEADLRGDFHMHTNWSDGAFSLEEMVEAAFHRGYKHIVITDHSKSLRVAHGLDESRLKEQMKAIRRLDEAYQKKGMRVFCGMEVDILPDGSLDLEEEALLALDYVVGSVHSKFNQPEKEMTERIVRAIRSHLIDAVGHPTGRLLGSRESYAVNVRKMIAVAAEEGCALEINGSPERLDVSSEIAREATAKGVKLVISSDAHHTGQLGNIRYGLDVARRGWLTKADTVNALPTEAFLDWIRSR